MLAVASAWLTACATAPVRSADHPAAVGMDRARPPADFTLSVTVLSRRSTSGGWPTLRPARYLVEPDGQFRVALGDGAGPEHYPARTRRLTATQAATLYERVVREGLDLRSTGIMPDDAAGSRAVFSGPARAAPGQSLVIVSMVAHDRRTVAVHDADESPRVAEFVRRLRELARLDR